MVDRAHLSGKVLKDPLQIEGRLSKGAIIASQVDLIVEQIPDIKRFFYIIERRAWRGVNESRYADIKLIEDLSLWDESQKRSPNAILLDIGPADFIDTSAFVPLGLTKDYDGIQISSWDRFKRPYLFIRGVALMPGSRFIRLGHYIRGGNLEELTLRDDCLEETRRIGANIDYPFAHLNSNEGMPQTKEEINRYINRSRLGILTTKVEGINRFKMECLSADVPVLVPEDTSYPTKKHITEETGLLFSPTPEGLARTIEYALANLEKFSPRKYILENTGQENSLKKLKRALRVLCERDGTTYHFEDVSWDGRNQSLVWGEEIFYLIKNSIERVK